MGIYRWVYIWNVICAPYGSEGFIERLLRYILAS